MGMAIINLTTFYLQVLPVASLKETRPLLTASTSTSTAPKVLLNYCEPKDNIKDSKKPKQKKSSVKSIKYLSGELLHTIKMVKI